jgi:hypothetical protein
VVLLFAARTSAGWFIVRWMFIGLISTASVLRISSLEYAGAEQLWRLAVQRSLSGMQRH